MRTSRRTLPFVNASSCASCGDEVREERWHGRSETEAAVVRETIADRRGVGVVPAGCGLPRHVLLGLLLLLFFFLLLRHREGPDETPPRAAESASKSQATARSKFLRGTSFLQQRT